MVIPPLSRPGWSFPCVLFRAKAHVSFFCISTLHSRLYSYSAYFCWHRGVPSFVGVMLGTPGLRYYAILCVAFPLIAFIN